MQNSQLIEQVSEEMKRRLAKDSTGHDWWHIDRVRNLAKRIAQAERADEFVVELAAIMHDIADWKFYDGNEQAGPNAARALLERYEVAPEIIDTVCTIILKLGFKGAGVPDEMPMLEGKIVQDADRLDALGAIGVARAFAYGGYRGRPLHDPNSKPILHTNKEDYLKGGTTSTNHFYEKLLLLKDRVHTETAQTIAVERHRFLEDFLDHFFKEWNGVL